MGATLVFTTDRRGGVRDNRHTLVVVTTVRDVVSDFAHFSMVIFAAQVDQLTWARRARESNGRDPVLGCP